MAESRKPGKASTPKETKAATRSAKQAEKARKKASTDPADMGRIRQIRRAYQLTHEYDKALPYLLLGAFLVPSGRPPSPPAC